MDYRNVSETRQYCYMVYSNELLWLICVSADSYIGSDHESYGRTMARVLKQLNPNGGKYGFVMQWESPGALQQRVGFNAEMAEDTSEEEDRPLWSEVERYPYERPYNLSVPCHHMVRRHTKHISRNLFME